MIYALWDIQTNNLVAEYDDLPAALDLVIRGIERNGLGDPDSHMLVAETAAGETRTIAHGQDLATLAYCDSAPNHRPSSALERPS